ncbi:phage portal protein [Escherichia coli]|uniref:phage portal protein n=1 Tax=Escherichia coli TaxID=562 RepID=UPI003890C825
MPGDSLNLQTAQDTDNGYSVFEQSLLRYIAAGLGVSYEQLSRNYAQMSYPRHGPVRTSRGRTLWGGENSSHPVRRARCFCAGWKRPSLAAW